MFSQFLFGYLNFGNFTKLHFVGSSEVAREPARNTNCSLHKHKKQLALEVYKSNKSKITSSKPTWLAGKWTLWRCISLLKMGNFQSAMLVYRSVIGKNKMFLKVTKTKIIASWNWSNKNKLSAGNTSFTQFTDAGFCVYSSKQPCSLKNWPNHPNLGAVFTWAILLASKNRQNSPVPPAEKTLSEANVNSRDQPKPTPKGAKGKGASVEKIAFKSCQSSSQIWQSTSNFRGHTNQWWPRSGSFPTFHRYRSACIDDRGPVVGGPWQDGLLAVKTHTETAVFPFSKTARFVSGKEHFDQFLRHVAWWIMGLTKKGDNFVIPLQLKCKLNPAEQANSKHVLTTQVV